MKWLILSHGFNMDGRAASLTVTDKIPYLSDLGIDPIILSAVTGKKDNHCTHYQLLPWGPSGLFFDLRHWFRVRFGKNLAYKIMMPSLLTALLPLLALERALVRLSSQWSWAYPAACKGLRLVRQGRVDVIYSSGGAWSAHYAAWIIKKITNVQWIAEIHDPMVIRRDLNEPPLPKHREQRFLLRLEAKICADADVIVWFTESAREHAKERHPILANKGLVIYPGSAPPGCEEALPAHHVYLDTLSLCHFGSLAENRSLAPLIDALALFFKQIPAAADKIKLHVYGASLDRCSIEALHRFNRVDVVIMHGRIEYDKHLGQSGRALIFQKMRVADVLLLLHGDTAWCSEYYPSKLYDYYWTNRPIFALTHRNPNLDVTLKKRQAYVSSTLDQESILVALNQLWEDWQNKQLRQPIFEPIKVSDAVSQMVDALSGCGEGHDDG